MKKNRFPLNYLTLENISKSFGEKILFHDINLTIGKGQKIALVAKNGTGKTTLLKVIAGEEGIEGENSKFLISKDIKTRYLKQEPYFDDNATVLEAALDSDNIKVKAIKTLQLANISGDNKTIENAIAQVEDLKAWDIEARIKEILGQLNIKNFDQNCGSLSGGQKKRLALAKILIEEPDFVILDEPTNHLDIDMIEWLEGYLTRQNLTLFMVTHDRYFLERVCTDIIELEGGNLYRYKGSYSDYLEKKSARVENEKANLAKTKKLFKRELDWMRRSPQARTTKAKSRIDKFYEIKEKAHQKIDEGSISMHIEMERLGSKILEAHSVSKAFGDIQICEHFSYKFKKRERVGLAGPNGAGKTTFIKILTKELKPDSGKIVVGDTVVFGHYKQDITDLNMDLRVIDCIREIADYIPLKKGKKMTAESLLERFLFPRPQQQVYVSQLSGGEKRRLQLLRVLMGNPNFLILDEPTNDLDLISLNVLEEFLLSYEGCLIVTSHDRFFMDKMIDHMFILEGNGNIKDYNGSYSDYRDEKKGLNNKSKAKVEKEEVAETTPEKRKLSYKEKMEIQALEKEMEKLEKRKAEINASFLDGSLSGTEISDLSKELGELETKLATNEDRWLELSEFS